MEGAVRRNGVHLDVDVRLTPRAAMDRIDGLERLSDGRPVIAARVRAVPEDGKANTALERLLAEMAGVPKSSATVIAGKTARLKTVRLRDAPVTAETALLTLLKG